MVRTLQSTPYISLLLIATLGSFLAACDDSTTGPEVTDPRLVRSVSAGYEHTCAITGDGELWCWGDGGWGRLGNGESGTRREPVKVQTDVTFAAVSAGGGHTCALAESGEAWCWGQSGGGALGDGSSDNSSVPVQVESDVTFTSLFAGGTHTCALTADGTAYCWGDNRQGQLGDGTTDHRTAPTPVLTSKRFKQLSAGPAAHTCGVTRDGETLCWGYNSKGQIGDGTAGEDEYRTQPTEVAGNTEFAVVYAGTFVTCALTGEGAAYCWGSNSMGSLGDGSGEDRSMPGPVSGSVSFRALSVSGHVCGVTEEGNAYCWGSNDYGQLGIGHRATATEPTTLATSERFASLAAGGAHTCGVTPGGALFCWGRNDDGQLGDGGLTQGFTVPAAVWRW